MTFDWTSRDGFIKFLPTVHVRADAGEALCPGKRKSYDNTSAITFFIFYFSLWIQLTKATVGYTAHNLAKDISRLVTLAQLCTGFFTASIEDSFL